MSVCLSLSIDDLFNRIASCVTFSITGWVAGLFLFNKRKRSQLCQGTERTFLLIWVEGQTAWWHPSPIPIQLLPPPFTTRTPANLSPFPGPLIHEQPVSSVSVAGSRGHFSSTARPPLRWGCPPVHGGDTTVFPHCVIRTFCAKWVRPWGPSDLTLAVSFCCTCDKVQTLCMGHTSSQGWSLPVPCSTPALPHSAFYV